ncbi:uncharacterized protein TERG_12249 [Trichophyton rubrum CBS 118892]|uniref:Uncharacterized protein n=1 Tax=Trichophyton rubrum (strain ATCC MYA-4607 / CBS 118892) TaxID=559305 RepID=A0A080WUU9_TRIRC|nr:uncharacterized protein TERG_12249 [Trichophyton rubrum CBS 118892]KFL61878.1 hypothetical protein TERG_12249 [Trichophyton rubrum CBS 118892]
MDLRCEGESVGQISTSGVPGWRDMRIPCCGSKCDSRAEMVTMQSTRGTEGPTIERPSTVMVSSPSSAPTLRIVEGEGEKNWRPADGIVGPVNCRIPSRVGHVS